MIITKENFIKIFISLLLILYLIFTVNIESNMIDASLTLLFSFLLLVKTRHNNMIFILTLFIFYNIYSIVVGEYFTFGKYGVALTQVKTLSVYGTTIRTMLIFTSILFLCFPQVKVTDIDMPYKKETLLFNILVIILILIGLFGVNRNLSQSYEVSISPIYEYSKILFIFAYFFSGNNKRRKIILSIILVIFVLQDFYYGGRITSLQLMIVLVSGMYNNKINFRNIIVGALIGLVIMNLVAYYRSSYSFEGASAIDTIRRIFNNYFVFDTATHSYYASATHVAAITENGVQAGVRLGSLMYFIKSVFIGGNELLGNVTRYVSEYYFLNVGGGLYPTHFYFWLDWVGVIISALVLVFYIRYYIKINSNFSKISLIAIISSSPRWFLYNPLVLFRTQLFVFILFVLYKSMNYIVVKNSKRLNFKYY